MQCLLVWSKITFIEDDMYELVNILFNNMGTGNNPWYYCPLLSIFRNLIKLQKTVITYLADLPILSPAIFKSTVYNLFSRIYRKGI